MKRKDSSKYGGTCQSTYLTILHRIEGFSAIILSVEIEVFRFSFFTIFVYFDFLFAGGKMISF